jgi:hypothetical protein
LKEEIALIDATSRKNLEQALEEADLKVYFLRHWLTVDIGDSGGVRPASLRNPNEMGSGRAESHQTE